MVPLAISRRFAVRPPVVRPFYDPLFQTRSMLDANWPEVQRAPLVNLQCDLFSLGELLRPAIRDGSAFLCATAESRGSQD